MQTSKVGVILVGHGGIPKDCPRDLIMKLKKLEGQRRDSGMPISPEERDLENVVGIGCRRDVRANKLAQPIAQRAPDRFRLAVWMNLRHR